MSYRVKYSRTLCSLVSAGSVVNTYSGYFLNILILFFAVFHVDRFVGVSFQAQKQAFSLHASAKLLVRLRCPLMNLIFRFSTFYSGFPQTPKWAFSLRVFDIHHHEIPLLVNLTAYVLFFRSRPSVSSGFS